MSFQLDDEQVKNIKDLLAKASAVVSEALNGNHSWMHYHLASAIKELDDAHYKCWEYFSFTSGE